MNRLLSPIGVRLTGDAERVRINHDERIKQIAASPFARGRLIKDVVLTAGVNTPVAHGMGRAVVVFVSPARGGSSVGGVAEIRSASHDPTRFVVLKADNWGATVTVDVWVM